MIGLAKLTLSPEEIDAERNVVQEEWRTRNNANFRMDKIVSNLRYNNSKFARRDVIGDMNIIINFEHESLLDFYRKWYRPNLQAIVIVGDFNVDEMEQRAEEDCLFFGESETEPRKDCVHHRR